MFALTKPEASNTKTMVTGKLSSADTLLLVLFDSGATHSFLSARVIDGFCRPSTEMSRDVHIIQASRHRVVSRWGVRALLVTVDVRELHVDVVELKIDDFDLIMGMDMLAK